MNREEISKALQHFVQTEILAGSRVIDEQTDLRTAGVDSFSVVEIILFIESRFGIVIPDEKLLPENFESLHNLSALVYELKSA